MLMVWRELTFWFRQRPSQFDKEPHVIIQQRIKDIRPIAGWHSSKIITESGSAPRIVYTI